MTTPNDSAPTAGGARPAAIGTQGSAKGRDQAGSEKTLIVRLATAVRLVLYVRDRTGAPLAHVPVKVLAPDRKLLEFDAASPDHAVLEATDARGRFAVMLNAKVPLGGDLRVQVNEATVGAEAVSLSLGSATLTLTASDLAGGDGKLSRDVRARGCVVRHVTLDLHPYRLRHRYLWQNAKLRPAVFPFRNVMLKRFLLYMEWFRLVEKVRNEACSGRVDEIGKAPRDEVWAALDIKSLDAFGDEVIAAREDIAARMRKVAQSVTSRTDEQIGTLDEHFFCPATDIQSLTPPPRAPNPPEEPGPEPPKPDPPGDDATPDERKAHERSEKAWKAEHKTWQARSKTYPKARARWEEQAAKAAKAEHEYQQEVSRRQARKHIEIHESPWALIRGATLLHYRKEIKPLTHKQAVARVDKVCQDNARFVPTWLRYMVIHYSGIGYKSAHDSFYREEPLLYYLRAAEVPIELGRDVRRSKPLPDADVVELCLEAEDALKDRADPPAAADLRAKLTAAMRKAHIPTGEWSTSALAGRGELLELLERIHIEVLGLGGVMSLSPADDARGEDYWTALEKVLGVLHSRWSAETVRLRDARYRFDDGTAREVARRTHFLRDTNETWPSAKEWSQWFPSPAVPSQASAVATWRDADSTRLCKAARAALSAHPRAKVWANENVTGWRQYHRLTLDPCTVRMVCNETEEQLLHARGGEPPGGLRLNAEHEKATLSPAISEDVYEGADGGSLFSLEWRTEENESASVVPGTMQPLVDYQNGYQFWKIARGSQQVLGPITNAYDDGVRVWERRDYVVPPDGPKRLTRTTLRKYTRGSDTSISESVFTETLTWDHQAPIVRVLDEDLSISGRHLLTFQTSYPIGINLDRKVIESMHKRPYVSHYVIRRPDVPFDHTHERVPTFLLELESRCDD